MPMNTVLLSIDGSRVAGSLREILDKLEGAEGELVVDFSQVHRVDSADVQALEALAVTAGAKSVKVLLCGVSGDVYKTLKLAKLASCFGFVR